MIYVRNVKDAGGYDANDNRYIIADMLCDTDSDLPSVNYFISAKCILFQGSTAEIIYSGAKYVMQSNGTWSLTQTGQAAYTKSEVDTLLADKADVTDIYTKSQVDAIVAGVDFCGVGTTIPANADLNRYTTKGVYNCGASNAATLSNCPVSAGFRLEVVEIAFSSRHQQRLYTQQISGDSIYIRTEGSSGYGNWYKFTGTQV